MSPEKDLASKTESRQSVAAGSSLHPTSHISDRKEKKEAGDSYTKVGHRFFLTVKETLRAKEQKENYPFCVLSLSKRTNGFPKESSDSVS